MEWYYPILGMIFYNAIVGFLYVNYRNKKDRPLPNRKYWFIIAVFILFGTIGIQLGDYPHYRMLVQDVYQQSLRYSGNSWLNGLHMEAIYNYLAVWCKGNYFLWRLAWYFVEFSAFGLMFKRLGHNNYQSLFVFSTCAMFSVCTGRVSIGIVYYFFGLYTFLVTKEYKYLIFVALSFFAHNSMLALLIILPVVLIKNSRTIIVASIIAAPLLIGAFGYFLQELTQNAILPEELIYKLGNNYMDSERSGNYGGSIGEIIQKSFERIPLLFLSVWLVYNVLKSKIKFSLELKRYLNVVLVLLLYVIVAFFADFGGASLFERFMVMLYVPMFLLVYCSKQVNIKKKYLNAYMFFLWMSFNLNYLKAAYYYYVGG